MKRIYTTLLAGFFALSTAFGCTPIKEGLEKLVKKEEPKVEVEFNGVIDGEEIHSEIVSGTGLPPYRSLFVVREFGTIDFTDRNLADRKVDWTLLRTNVQDIVDSPDHPLYAGVQRTYAHYLDKIKQ